MIKRLSLASRLALLFAACTAVVSLLAGVLFNHASEAHFIELDQQLLDSKLVALRSTLLGVDTPQQFSQKEAQLRAELSRQPDLALHISAADQLWFDDAPGVTLPASPGLHRLHKAGTDYRIYNVPLMPGQPNSPQLSLMLDITHHQHFPATHAAPHLAHRRPIGPGHGAARRLGSAQWAAAIAAHG